MIQFVVVNVLSYGYTVACSQRETTFQIINTILHVPRLKNPNWQESDQFVGYIILQA